MASSSDRKTVAVAADIMVVGKPTTESVSAGLDMTGFRMGKQRIVSRKKKPSALKKVILDERDDKKAECLLTGKVILLPNSAGDVPVPEFVPLWTSSASNTELLDGPTDIGGVSFLPSWCATDLHNVEKAPVCAPVAKVGSEDLAVGEALERMRAMQGNGAQAKKKTKERQHNKGADIEVRHYVHQILSDELDEKIKVILGELARFQERAKEKDPMKFAKLKRLCFGMREAQRSVAREKAKALIVAPNLEESSMEGGLDDALEDLIDLCREHEVPVIFALSRNRIGKALGKNIRLSIVCLLSVEGVHKDFKDALKITEDLRKQWLLKKMEQMASVSPEEAEAERVRAVELTDRRAARKEERLRLEAAQRAEEEERRQKDRERKAKEKEERQVERAKRLAEQRVLREQQKAEEAVEQERQERMEADKRAAERAKEVERMDKERKIAEQRVAAERQRAEAEAKKRMEDAAKLQASLAVSTADDDEDSDDDLPAGFNASLF